MITQWERLVGRTRRTGQCEPRWLWRRVSPCCFRRARARYWRIAYTYAGIGAALGVAVGMLLGAASKVCP